MADYLKWLRNLSELVLKTTEDFGEVPGSATPVVNTLIDVAKWDQKRAAKPKIIENLCQKHRIDQNTVNSLEDLKNAGISEQEIEITFARAISKIDNPSLVRYLESLKTDFDQQLIEHFNQLHSSLKGPYRLIQPAETILQNPPTQKMFAQPTFFRKTGPVFADFEGGKVVVRQEVEGTIKALIQKKSVLLVGISATGKSVIIRNICHEWIKNGWSARVVELKKESANLDRLIDETDRFGKEDANSLLIIEDAHLAPTLINNYLSRRNNAWPKLLITSRTGKPELHAESINEFENLHAIELEPFDPADQIIDLFLKAKAKEGWDIESTLKHSIKAYTKNSLWVLSYALNSLDDTHGKAIDDKSVLRQVEKDLNSLKHQPANLPASTKQLFIPLLVSLSILYGSEIPTDKRFLQQWIDDANTFELDVAINELEIMGEVFVIKENGAQLFGLPHSALANLYYRYAEESIYAPYVDSLKFVEDYAVSPCAHNSLQLFRQVCIINTVEDKVWIELYSPSFFYKSDLSLLSAKIEQSEDLLSIERCLNGIFASSVEHALEVMSFIDMSKLASKIEQSHDLSSAIRCMEAINQINEEALKELIILFDKKKLADKVSQGKDILGLQKLLSFILSINKEVGKEIIVHLDKKKIVSTIDKNIYLEDQILFMVAICQLDHEEGKKILELVNKKKLIANIQRSPITLKAIFGLDFLYSISPSTAKSLRREIIDKKKSFKNIFF